MFGDFTLLAAKRRLLLRLRSPCGHVKFQARTHYGRLTVKQEIPTTTAMFAGSYVSVMMVNKKMGEKKKRTTKKSKKRKKQKKKMKKKKDEQEEKEKEEGEEEEKNNCNIIKLYSLHM